MRKTKTYQNDSPLEYGFILKEQSAESVSLPAICARATTSITIVDTGNYILDEFLNECVGVLNEKRVVVAGLVSKKTLAGLKDKGVYTGFFRATNEIVDLGLLIIDKKEAWACFGPNHIHRIINGSEEVFQFANHLLWTKTDNEYASGEFRQVQQAMLSVIMPTPEIGVTAGSLPHDYATPGLLNKKGAIVNELRDYSQPAIAMPLNCKAFMDQNRLSVEILPDAYYEIEGGENLVFATSFAPGATPKDLVGKEVYYKGNKTRVRDVEEMNANLYVPLDEVADYEPDFDAIYAKREQLSVRTEINVNILPKKRDDSFQLAPNYKTKSQIEERISESFERLEKLDLDDKKIEKQIKTVQSERVFEEKVRLYNELVNGLDYGIEALKNKKNSFPTINQSKESFVVPHEMLGTLLTKQGTRYLALENEGKIKEGKAWLKESGIEAILILDSKE